jgi:DNA polymerase III epsilon subunit-like protein
MDLKHLNGNILCVIDVETTGLVVGKNEIIQICILPLNHRLEPDPEIMPFDMYIKPQYEIDSHVKRTNRKLLAKAINMGVDPYYAAELFDAWVDGLHLKEGKRISPLAQNWAFDREFIKDWLGDENFTYRIDGRYRDLMSVALFLNDVAAIHVEPYPFPKVNLRYLASQLKIDTEEERFHDAVYDCIVTAKVYKQMVQDSSYI